VFDAVLILGGGVRERAELPPWAQARFDRALERANGEVFVCLSAGTTHRPPPLDHGYPILESVAGARYLMTQGIAPDRIRIEALSLDTIGNAYFAKLLHVDPAKWSRLLVVTSEFHMPRTRAIFEWVFGFEAGRYSVEFDASPNTGMSDTVLALRSEKERRSLNGLQLLRQKIHSLPQLHEWMFSEHGAYSAAGRCKQASGHDPDLVDSY
jgi:uncharacterized SAM-binding protein YcdF (DUF218 family)